MGGKLLERAVHLRDKDAAEILKLSVATLRKWRCRGVGPRWRKFGGAVRYAVADLEAWAADQGRDSTSDTGAAA